MKKDLTELVIILDRSGSMAGLESDTIGGYNAMIEKQRKEPGQAIVTTLLFDDRVDVVHDRVALNQVPVLTDKEYFVRGCTALLDAVGSAISRIDAGQKGHPKDERPEKTVFVITTDGLENASREYSYDKVKRLVEGHKAQAGWEFLFLGANMDAIAVAGRFGIDVDRAATYKSDAAGTRLNYQVVGAAISQLRCCSSLDADWKRDIEEDQKR